MRLDQSLTDFPLNCDLFDRRRLPVLHHQPSLPAAVSLFDSVDLQLWTDRDSLQPVCRRTGRDESRAGFRIRSDRSRQSRSEMDGVVRRFFIDGDANLALSGDPASSLEAGAKQMRAGGGIS